MKVRKNEYISECTAIDMQVGMCLFFMRGQGE